MFTLGAVGYLNALPLVHGLEKHPLLDIVRRVPSAFLEDLENGELDVALCPVIDLQMSRRDLVLVPVGGIGSRARTLTVRVFSRVPLASVRRLFVDGDSHTSVALAQIVFRRLFDTAVPVSPLGDPGRLEGRADVDAALLIGDKVVTAEPSRNIFPHQLDLGEAWREITGLPFVFAGWAAPAGRDLGRLPDILTQQRRENLLSIADHAPTWAEEHGWPAGLALTYLEELLDYSIEAEHLQAIERFWRECAEIGLIDSLRPLQLYE